MVSIIDESIIICSGFIYLQLSNRNRIICGILCIEFWKYIPRNRNKYQESFSSQPMLPWTLAECPCAILWALRPVVSKPIAWRAICENNLPTGTKLMRWFCLFQGPVACKQLGYSGYVGFLRFSPQPEDQVAFSGLTCTGNESKLSECTEDPTAVCQPLSIICSWFKPTFHCTFT